MIYKYLLLSVFCVIGYAGAITDNVRPTYKGKILTPENLLSTLQEACPASPELQEQSAHWLNSNETLVRFLIGKAGLNHLWKLEQGYKNEVLRQEGYQNESNFNHVFKAFKVLVGDENGKVYRVFIAGRINKLNNKLAEIGLHGKPISKKQFNALEADNTHQTVSRGLGYLVFMQSKEDNNAIHIETPKTYVIQLPEGDETKPIDETTIIVQEEIEGAQSIKECSEVTEEELVELYHITRDALLWNIKAQDLLRSSQDNKLYVVDLEHPNDTFKLAERTRESHEQLSVLSIQELIKFCAKCPGHLARLKALIEKDEKVQQYHESRHQNALNSVLQCLNNESATPEVAENNTRG